MNEFDSAMSVLSDYELYEIIYYKRDSYTSKALTAAEKVYTSRSLSPELIASFESQIKAHQHKEQVLIKHTTELKNLFNFTEKWTIFKSLQVVFLLLIGLYFYYLIKNIPHIKMILSDYGHLGLDDAISLSPYILFPIGIYGTWKYKKYGWYLTIAQLSLFACISIYLVIDNLNHYYKGDEMAYVLHELFSKSAIIGLAIRAVIFIGIIIFFHRVNVLSIFNIKKKNGILVVFSMVVLMTLLWLLPLYYN